MLKREIPVRSYTGERWITNKTNKKYLAIDFKHRCAYCDDCDSTYNGENSYAVEHFAPKGKFPHLRYTYDNLLYACSYCNEAKSDDWPSKSPAITVVGDCGYIDPCKKEYYDHLDRDDETGRIIFKTELGKYMYEHLNLGLKRHSIIFMLEKLEEKRNLLEKSIEEDNKRGIDASAKEKVLLIIDKDFFSYYRDLRNIHKE